MTLAGLYRLYPSDLRHRSIACERNSRRWLEEMSWRGMWNRLAIGSWIETKRCRCRCDLKRFMIGVGSRWRRRDRILRPQPDGLVRDSDPTGSQQVLNHSQAQRETEIEPNRMGDDLTGIAMPTVKRISICHAPSSHSGLHIPLSLRCRWW